MNTPNAPKRVMSAITLPRVAQELAYAVACRHYLEATTHHNLTHLPPLRPLGLAPVPPLPKGADPLAAAGAGGDDDARRQRAAGQQAATAAGLLCRVGLYESAANLLRAFGLPMTPVVQGLARAVVVLRGRRGGDWPMVGEDGVGWEVGVDEEGATAEEKRRAAFLRLAGVEMEGEGEEEIGAAKGGEAAAWLLRDVVQRWDWAHAFGLHVEAARWMLAADSFAALPRWLVCAFTRGAFWMCVCGGVVVGLFWDLDVDVHPIPKTQTPKPKLITGVEAHLLVPSTQRNANKKQRPNNNNSRCVHE